jgi:hypothetical protein
MVLRHPGRPKAPLLPATAVITRQVRRLVDEAHLGNLREAAAHADVPYGTLRDLYAGRSLSPGLLTLQRLADHYRLPLEWFTERGVDAPLTALQGILPPDPEVGRGGLRRINIPLAAWSLARLFLVLEPYLRSLAPGPARPILGGAVDQESCRRRLTEFLLAPLIEAHETGQLVLLGADPPFRGSERPTAEERLIWIATLRRLGDFWSLALGDLLGRAERAT